MRKTISALAVLAVLAMPAVAARMWKAPPEPAQTATDYVHILDVRDPSTIVSVQWLAPGMMDDKVVSYKSLDDYVVIGVFHLTKDQNDLTSVDEADPIPLDVEGRPLVPISLADMPDDFKTYYADMQKRLAAGTAGAKDAPSDPRARKTIDAFAKAIRFYFFKTGAVHACTKGRLTVRYAGEDYSFDTPIPGCK